MHLPGRIPAEYATELRILRSQEGTWVAIKFLGSLETDVFEVAPSHYVHVEQHRSATDRSYDPGERETISWAANAGVLLVR